MPTLPRRQQLRQPLFGLLLLTAIAGAFLLAAPAGAAPSCARQVIDDWYDDGRIDGSYALHCYDDAIEILPRDVRDYSSAKEDIERALQAKMRGESPPPARTDPSPDKPKPPKPPKPSTDTTATTTGLGGPLPTDPHGPPEVAPPTDGASASSVPIPLLILAGLALLLIAGGSAGYLVRRYQGRNAPPPAV